MFELAKDHFEKVLSNDGHKFVIEKGIFSPTNDKYGEKRNILKASIRVNMIKIGIINAKVNDWIFCDDWETKQSDWVPTINALNHQQQLIDAEYKDVDSDKKPTIKLLCGADLIQSFAKPGLWKSQDIEDIVSKFGLVIISRVGADAAKFIDGHEVLNKYKKCIELINEPITNSISSTLIRQQVKEGKSIKYFVPDDVDTLIREHNLYKH